MKKDIKEGTTRTQVKGGVVRTTGTQAPKPKPLPPPPMRKPK